MDGQIFNATASEGIRTAFERVQTCPWSVARMSSLWVCMSEYKVTCCSVQKTPEAHFVKSDVHIHLPEGQVFCPLATLDLE